MIGLKKMQCIHLIILIFVVLGSAMLLKDSGFVVNESFTLMNRGEYPKAHMHPLLADSFPLKSKPGPSNLSMEDQEADYPVYETGNYDQKTNNERFWLWPNNGRASPPSFAGSLYEKKLELEKPTPVNPPNWNSHKTRVNFYNSC